MKTIQPLAIRAYLDKFMCNVADEVTSKEIEQGLLAYYPGEVLKINVGYDYYGYLDIRLEFESEEDLIIFKLKHGSWLIE